MPVKNPTVYSSELGRICPVCGKPQAACVCKKNSAPAPAAAGPLRVGRESKGRKGKTVTLITGLVLAEPALRALLSELKRQCGTGGTLKDGVIELQGDHRDLAVDILKKQGLNPKKTGG